MKIASILASILLVIWVVLSILTLWTDVLNSAMYIKLSITIGILAIAVILIALALREYGTEKRLKDHNYLD